MATEEDDVLLIIEDSPEDYEATRRALIKSGMHNGIRHCKDGDDGLDYLFCRGEYAQPGAAPRPGLILLDLNMPGTDGREVLAEIKRDDSLKSIPVIVLTTSSDERDIQACYAAGANSYVEKPVGLDGLMQAIRRLHDYWFKIVVFPKNMDETLRILVVDDSPEDRAAYGRFLSSMRDKFDIRETDSGEEGLTLCREAPPDCVLLDYHLPDLDGLEFLTELRKIADHDQIAVVMLTGEGNEAVAVEAMKIGAQDYLVKSDVTAIGFQRAISNAVEKASLLRELEQQRKELQRSNRELEQFAYQASHDLQAPLRRTQGFCELLQRRYAGQLDTEADDFIDSIVQSTAQLQALVSGLLAYSRVGSQGKPLEPTDLNEVVQQAITNLEVPIQESGARVTFDRMPVVAADRLQMVQLLQNLLSNGIKYQGQQPPEVHVSASPGDGEVRVAVSDNGIGIEPEHAEEVFAIFKRLHGDSVYEGTGIGLAICKKIVERHGGRIWVESEPGKGSVFYFSLPDTPDGQ